MKISTKGRYGLRTLIDIALHEVNGTVTLNEIAKRQGISVKYLWQVANPLKTAGVLRVTRGAKGGYTLARSPEEITLHEIVTILEGNMNLVDCLDKGQPCLPNANCVAHSIWLEVNEAVAKAFSGITLASILERCREAASIENYSI